MMKYLVLSHYLIRLSSLSSINYILVFINVCSNLMISSLRLVYEADSLCWVSYMHLWEMRSLET